MLLYMAGAALASRAAPSGSAPRFRGMSITSTLSASWRYPAALALLVGLYYGSAQLGYALKFTGAVAAIVWLPVGVGIAFLYLGGIRFWPGVVVGDLLANNYTTLPVGSALGQSAGNVLEVMVAVVLLRRLVPDGAALGSIRRLTSLLVALVAGTAVSATIGLLSLRLGQVVSGGDLPKLWRTWWLGDLSGALIVTPLVLAWHPLPPMAWLRQRWAEGLLLIIAIVGFSELSFRSNHPVTYLVFPALILAALRFGARGATLAVAIAGGHAVWATTHYEGPFVFDSISRSILATQLYIAVAALSSLSLAAVVAERDRLAGRLRASRARLMRASDGERRRIEQNLHDGAQQRLTALAINLGIAAEEAEAQPANSAALFRLAEHEVCGAIDELRDLAHGLHPPALKKFGLARAVREMAARSSVPVVLREPPPMRFEDAVEATAYFLLIETLANAQKHSHASRVRISLSWSGGLLHLIVADDGVGGAKETEGLGLQGLRDRVEAVGGTIAIDSPVGNGTRLEMSIPAPLAA
jgi:signal transduction histidine kinase